MNENREQILGEITALKSLLRDTDYEVTKYAEGLTDCATQEEIEAYREDFLNRYDDIISRRKSWRVKINELEDQLDNLPDDQDEPEINLEDAPEDQEGEPEDQEDQESEPEDDGDPETAPEEEPEE